MAVCLPRKHCAEEDLASVGLPRSRRYRRFLLLDCSTEAHPKSQKSLASKKVSPKGPQSGMRMLNCYINRAGRNLSLARRRELNKAKTLLSRRIQATKT